MGRHPIVHVGLAFYGVAIQSLLMVFVVEINVYAIVQFISIFFCFSLSLWSYCIREKFPFFSALFLVIGTGSCMGVGIWGISAEMNPLFLRLIAVMAMTWTLLFTCFFMHIFAREHKQVYPRFTSV